MYWLKNSVIEKKDWEVKYGNRMWVKEWIIGIRDILFLVFSIYNRDNIIFLVNIGYV